MPKKEVPIAQLASYLPENTYDAVLHYLNLYKVHLTITKSRQTILGDYRHKYDGLHHRISINGNLNKYAFLITLLHELAHLLTFEQFGRRVKSHGREWKNIYAQLLAQFIEHKIFPPDVEAELKKSLHNPDASTCAEEGLQRVLFRYDDDKKENYVLVEQVPQGHLFEINGGRIFRRGNKRVKRYECTEVRTGRSFLFSAVYEVLYIGENI